MSTSTLDRPISTFDKTIADDGFIIDPETGEVLGVVVPVEFESDTDNKEAVPPIGFIEWVLGKIHGKDAIAKAQGRKAQALEDEVEQRAAAALEVFYQEPETVALMARIAALTKQANAASKAADWLQTAYAPTLGNFARLMTKGQRTRTWNSPSGFGGISLVSQPAKVTVTNDAAAIAFAEEWAPETVRKFTTTELDAKALKSHILALYAEAPADLDAEATEERLAKESALYASRAFEYVPSFDKVTVKTGIK